ncbi:hypothetical protein [Ochrobactrum sp. Marseille-Q0166]|uniref:hypothetical protein n=1 Tax=Ochrobactrum sp. Marseille-Q0166 TaxID=2761105 RepID=UPI001655CFD5|nr:hypothetical protein [Ochrobactrum sp. Marseille-Q0166]MBC8719276.1 hypothetical protein [Ochrobactrum sp. Marseille-Q0166]
MGWFSPNPMQLKFGEPVHQMAIRALLSGALKPDSESILTSTKYHFVGPHGIVYRGKDRTWRRNTSNFASGLAQLCEEIQQDFNERIAAQEKAREYARDKLSVPSLFASVTKQEEPA